MGMKSLLSVAVFNSNQMVPSSGCHWASGKLLLHLSSYDKSDRQKNKCCCATFCCVEKFRDSSQTIVVGDLHVLSH